MDNARLTFLLVPLLVLGGCVRAVENRATGAGDTYTKWNPGHYVLMLGTYKGRRMTEPTFARIVAALPEEIVGVRMGAAWRVLEPRRDVYDFSRIEKALALCTKHNKTLMLGISERRFGSSARAVPDYLYNDPEFRGGIEPFRTDRSGTTKGSMARVWDPAVLARWTGLIHALGDRFDSEPSFEGIVLPETALAVPLKSQGLTEKSYMHALRTQIAAASEAFPHSVVLQQVNWLHGERERQVKLFEELADFCYQVGAGCGGPDLVPDRQRAADRPRIPAYEVYPKYAGRIPLGVDVQVPQYTGWAGSRFEGELTPAAIHDMGHNTLKLNYIFWSLVEGDKVEGRRPRFTFSGDIVPMLRKVGWRTHADCPQNIRPGRGTRR